MKKTVLIMLSTILLFSIVTGCSSNNDKTSISILSQKPEIQKQMEAIAEVYMNENPDVEIIVESITGQDPMAELSSRYNSGAAPDIYHLAGVEIAKWQEHLEPLSNEPWIDDAFEGTLETARIGDDIYGMPVTIEGFGFIYNKDVFNEAGVKAEDIKTFEDLEAAMIAIENIGKPAISISALDWSLGAHFTNVAYANMDDPYGFLNELKSGQATTNNETFNAWLDVFDLMIEHNNTDVFQSNKYDEPAAAIANGDVGMWFMGNWAIGPILEANPDANIGLMNVPINANKDGNTKLSVGVPMYWVVDKSQTTEKEVEVAKDFLNWLITSEEGQKFIVEEAKMIPVFNNIDSQPSDPLSKDVLKYAQQNETLPWINLEYPTGGWTIKGDAMIKYADGKMTREELFNGFDKVWLGK